MPNTIKVKRGKSAALNTSTEKLQAGEILYNLDKNYLTVGAEDNDALTKKPVAAREIVGYTGDTDSKIGTSTTEAYSIKYDTQLKIKDGDNTLLVPKKDGTLATTEDIAAELENYYTKTESDAKYSQATNLANGTGTGSIQQKGITYDKLITDYEPNMAAWIIAKNNGVVPANVSVYLTALQNNIIPTSEQVVDILNNSRTDVNIVITKFKTLQSPYEEYGIDSLIAGKLEGYGITSSSDLSNTVGKIGSSATILGAMNKAFSPGAFAGGVGCEAGDEGYPGDTVCSFAYGSNVKTKGIFSVGFGRDLENLGDTSAVFGRGNKEYKIEGSEVDKTNQRIYLDNLAEVGGTVTGTGDSRVGITGINKGTNNFMAGNSHYIGEGADNNAVLGNQNVIYGYNNSIVGGLINFIRAENSTILGGSKNRIDYGFGNLLNGSSNSNLYSKNCLSSGNGNEINQGDCILNSGYENKILREVYSGAIGHGLTLSDGKERFAVGAFNIDNPKAALMVGNGTSDTDRKNAFEVLEDGRAKVQSAPAEDDDVVRLNEVFELTQEQVDSLF